MKINTELKQKDSVLFVTQSSDASKFFNLLFENNQYLNDHYFIDGTLATRELAVREVKHKKINLVIFVDRTPGNMSISEAVYTLRMYGCRVIYISTQRQVGDLVLEAIVGYGVYDIIMSTKINEEVLVDIIKHPREFRHVAIFHRMVDVSDNAGINGEKKFIIPGLDEYLAAGGQITQSYLTDPAEKIANTSKSYVDESDDLTSTRDVLYHEKPEKKANAIPKSKRRKSNNNHLKDIDDLFD